jgi:hypothetical protein
MAALRRGPLERVLAWLYTGPLGHLYGALADISVMWMRWSRLRLRRAYSSKR